MNATRAGCLRWADVVVVGGGPAGSAAAIGLARRGATVVVLERTRYEEQRVGETLRPGDPLVAARPRRRGVFARVRPPFVSGDPQRVGEAPSRASAAECSIRTGAAGTWTVGSSTRTCRAPPAARVRWFSKAPPSPPASGEGPSGGSAVPGRTGASTCRVASSSTRPDGARRWLARRALGACAPIRQSVAVVGYLGGAWQKPRALRAHRGRRARLVVHRAASRKPACGRVPDGRQPGGRTSGPSLGRRPARRAVHGRPAVGPRRGRRGPMRRGGRQLAGPRLGAGLAGGRRRRGGARPALRARRALRALRGGLRGAEALAQAAEGQPSALEAHADDAAREVAPSVRERARVYGREHRFRDAPFWARRHRRPEAIAGATAVAGGPPEGRHQAVASGTSLR